MRHVLNALFLSVLALSLAVAGTTARSEDDLKAAAAATGMLGEMTAITKLAGLDNAEVDVGPLTLFAPSDCAFRALPESIRARLVRPENRDLLVQMLLHHAVPGEFPTERLLKARAKHYAVDAIDGSEVEVTIRRGLDIEGARIIRPDIMATDGIIHVIDRVLMPDHVLAALEQRGDTVNTAEAVMREAGGPSEAGDH